MRLNVKQTQAIALEVQKQLELQFIQNNTELLNDLKELKNKKNNIYKKIAKKSLEITNLENEVRTELSKFNELHGVNMSIYDIYNNDSDGTKTLAKLAKTKIPSIDNIVQKITLETLFSTAEDLDKFIKSVVGKYLEK